MFFLSLEEKGHAFFYKENTNAATVTMRLQLFMMHTIVNMINTVIWNLLSTVKEMWILWVLLEREFNFVFKEFSLKFNFFNLK